LKWQRHFVAGALFAVPSALCFLVSGASLCSDIFGPISSCTFGIDYETLATGAVLTFIAASEFVLGFKRKNGGEQFWESEGQRILRRSGLLAMLAGFIASIYGLSKTLGTGTSSLLPWNASGTYGLLVYAGLIFVTAGTALIFGSRYTKIKPVRSATVKVLTQPN
jgi:hypothetical protein